MRHRLGGNGLDHPGLFIFGAPIAHVLPCCLVRENPVTVRLSGIKAGCCRIGSIGAEDHPEVLLLVNQDDAVEQTVHIAI